ncbi:protein-L-isoaspartate(D-aspartate) O-methyltransferase [Lysobacter sp. CFH 32150]|uniref:protein-L-isoaspartate(D-aspartate) O-methyltransferase n=1 Tax=Lysobacter sp. CFH 32150 TaxID=2927128 RepID=UPI001FA75A4F|nr:protein-L-isoaspartate(D-aspartate) O-methyltransferase [Lysobacter sp. CFH 32150]MCI4568830.1 protein-L-isoaspartate(D-aspartate) O-methyltransferase [Lysobacter sp. CFH 32150]
MTARIRLQPEAIGMGMTSQRVRDRLIDRLRETGIRDERVLNAIRTVPRHLFVDEAFATRAYEDTALPIGHGQTISQPWVVAKMTEALLQDAQPKRVLEVGTGSGYQAAILAALGLEVFTVERIGELLRTARKRFRTLGMNIRSKHDDGRIGWPELGPFDAIIVTAAAPALVSALTDQLAPGGTLVAPVGGAASQSLLRLRKDADGVIEETNLAPVVFVPLLSGMID